MTVAETKPAPLRVETRFGTFDVDADQLVRFPGGIPGFEQCQRFVLLSAPEFAPIQCLQSVGPQPASFLVIDPRLVLPHFDLQLSDSDRERLEAGPDASLVWLAIVTLGDGDCPVVNLRAPIVINPERMTGLQIVTGDTRYPLRHPLPGV